MSLPAGAFNELDISHPQQYAPRYDLSVGLVRHDPSNMYPAPSFLNSASFDRTVHAGQGNHYFGQPASQYIQPYQTATQPGVYVGVSGAPSPHAVSPYGHTRAGMPVQQLAYTMQPSYGGAHQIMVSTAASQHPMQTRSNSIQMTIPTTVSRQSQQLYSGTAAAYPNRVAAIW